MDKDGSNSLHVDFDGQHIQNQVMATRGLPNIIEWLLLFQMVSCTNNSDAFVMFMLTSCFDHQLINEISLSGVNFNLLNN